MGVNALVQVNLDLLSVGIAIAGILLLGCIIYFNNRKSITNETFLYFSILTAIWGISNYLEYRFTTIDAALWALRTHLFFSTWHAFLFFQLAYVFPKEKIEFPNWYKYGLFPLVAITSFFTMTPFVFSGISAIAPIGEVTNPDRGPGIGLFVMVAVGLLIMGSVVLARKMFGNKGEEHRQLTPVFIGMTITACLILYFNVILPVIFNQLGFIPLAALFILPFIALISYAIYRHHLFNLKVAATAFLAFMVSVFSFVNVVYSTSVSAVAINIAAFVIILLGSIKIVQDQFSLEVANERLQELDRMKNEFLSIASHQLRAPITAVRGYASLILEGDYGAVPDHLKEPLQRMADSARNMANSIEDYLNISRIEQGRMKYEKVSFDIADLGKKVVEEFTPVASRRNLELKFASTGPLMVMADIGKVKQVVTNLVDNSIKYTEKGSITVSVEKAGDKARVTISDTGMGIREDEIHGLFEKFTRARDANKVNTTGTGLGLYVARQLVEGHGGKIWAESDGLGKGSRFIVELPL